MCGRYTHRYTWAQIHRLIRLAIPEDGQPALIPECFNVAPTMLAPVVRVHKDGRRMLDMLTWGLVPFFSKAPTLGKMINARAEDVSIKPAFRGAFQKRRCLVPASGFYEWRAAEGSGRRQPYYIRPRSDEPIFFAGLWEYWKQREDQPDEQPVTSFTILTTTPNEVLAPIHDRMPVIVGPRDFDLWLDPSVADASRLAGLMAPCQNDLLEAYPVGTRVNSPKNDGTDLVERVKE
jgi:putative SOS response-associated peptidase YedK